MIESKLKLAFLVVGVWITWTLFGFAMERLTSTGFGEDDAHFEFTWSIVLVQSIPSSCTAALLLYLTGHKNLSGGVPAREWIFAGAAFLGAANFGLMSLHYIIYPMQVLIKSCKAIPVMFGEVIFEHHVKLTLPKIVSVTLLCSGVLVFTIGKGAKTGHDFEFDEKLMIGLVLVTFELLCDGIYGPYQNRIKTKARQRDAPIVGYHNMFNMNLWQGVFALCACLVTGELPKVAAFIAARPSVLIPMAEYAGAVAVGQVFIFQLQSNFGALLVAKVTTVRKLISVLFSVWYYGHSMNVLQWAGVALVFMSEPLAKIIAGCRRSRDDQPRMITSQGSQELSSSIRAISSGISLFRSV
mmetsp:Transcript_43141/g.125634  ORF Transcript_43141/g.125634 Transcript_43141/m.125634 type:complete len:355 (-) Transcript_43141:169-1233(-)